jgi:Zn-dependent protease with chaperone function
MDFVTVFLLLIPLIALYVRAPEESVTAFEAARGLGLAALASAAWLAAGLLLLHLYVARRQRRVAARGAEGSLALGRANGLFIGILSLLFFWEVHQLRLKESFERLFFSSELFLLSDGFLLLPFLVPFILFRAWSGRVGLRWRGLPARLGAEIGRQVRTTGVMLLPQLLYLNTYRAVVHDLPFTAQWCQRYPLLGFVVAGTLLLLLFVFSPYFVRLLYDRVALARYPGAEMLALHLQSLASTTGTSLSRVFVWLTRERRIANAAVAGLLGRQRTVFLTDHLLATLTVGEVSAVVAHEIGHTRFLHLLFNLLIAVMSGVFVIWGLALLDTRLESQEDLGMAVMALEVLYIAVVFRFFSRRFESQADLYAAHAVGDPAVVASALNKLALANHTSPNRGSITHPSIRQRVASLMRAHERFGGNLRPLLRKAKMGNALLALGMVALFLATLLYLDHFPE